MNINNLLKTGILACTMIFSINNNVNATNIDNTKWTCHNVNDKVFQHNVSINNGEDWNFFAYNYYVPQKKHYMKNSDTGCFEEIQKDPRPVDDNNEVYMAYADNEYEFNYRKYNCKTEKHYHPFKPTYIELEDDIKLADDVKNKFNKLYEMKINSNIIGDAKTEFANEVHSVFGDDYKVIENTSEDFGRVLEKYPGNRIKARMKDGKEKDLIRIFPTYRFGYDFDKINYLLKNNGFELVTQFEKYGWDKGIVVKNKNNEEKRLNIKYSSDDEYFTNKMSLYSLGMEVIIITNGCYVIVFDHADKKINIYRNLHAKNESKLVDDEKLFDNLNKVGLALQEASEKEIKAVKEVFGQNFHLHYK